MTDGSLLAQPNSDSSHTVCSGQITAPLGAMRQATVDSFHTAGEYKSFALGRFSPKLMPFPFFPLLKYADRAERHHHCRRRSDRRARQWSPQKARDILTMPVWHRRRQIHSTHPQWQLQHPSQPAPSDELSAQIKWDKNNSVGAVLKAPRGVWKITDFGLTGWNHK